MVSVIIAAHNEESVLERCLGAVARGGMPVQVIVSANGCHDATAEVARTLHATVVEREQPGKAAALNAAERVAEGFPRIYLDADIVTPPGGIAALVAALGTPAGLDGEVLAVVPRRRVSTAGRPWPVRAYFRINQALPVFRDGLFGRGMIVLSEAGRRRFKDFPEMIADDLFLDAQFTAAEKREVAEVEVVVEAPWSTDDLLRRLVRVRRGNAQLRRAATEREVPADVRPSDRWSWLRDVVLPRPELIPDAVAYVAITVFAGMWARVQPAGGWGRDNSTRTPHPARIDSSEIDT